MSMLIRASCLIWQSADSLGAKAIRFSATSEFRPRFVVIGISRCAPTKPPGQASLDLFIRTAGKRRTHWVRQRRRALSVLSSARGPGCSNRAARPELALLIRSIPTRADLFHHLSPITLARAGLGRFSPPCVNRYSNQNTTRHLSPHQLARAKTESHPVAFRYLVANDVTI